MVARARWDWCKAAYKLLGNVKTNENEMTYIVIISFLLFMFKFHMEIKFFNIVRLRFHHFKLLVTVFFILLLTFISCDWLIRMVSGKRQGLFLRNSKFFLKEDFLYFTDSFNVNLTRKLKEILVTITSPKKWLRLLMIKKKYNTLVETYRRNTSYSINGNTLDAPK